MSPYISSFQIGFGGRSLTLRNHQYALSRHTPTKVFINKTYSISTIRTLKLPINFLPKIIRKQRILLRQTPRSLFRYHILRMCLLPHSYNEQQKHKKPPPQPLSERRGE